mmetsp:Transcript_10737/g.32350  ORF Transcript_10737/g.32350 Transcript_10737/m.32350 type:complete len:301 (+) Transcript_10737:220-1122(+)
MRVRVRRLQRDGPREVRGRRFQVPPRVQRGAEVVVADRAVVVVGDDALVGRDGARDVVHLHVAVPDVDRRVRVVRRDAQRVLEALDRIPEAPLLLVYVPEVVQRAVVVRIEREHAAVAARGVVEVARVLQRRAEVEQNVRARPVEARGLHELRDGLVEFAPAVAVDGLRPVAVRELALLLRRGGARDASEEVLGFAREVRGAPPVHEATAHASEPPAVGRIHRGARRSWAVRRGAAAGRLASTRAGPCGPSLMNGWAALTAARSATARSSAALASSHNCAYGSTEAGGARQNRKFCVAWL